MCYIINCCLSSTVHFYFNALFTLEEAQGFTLQKIRKTQIHTFSEQRGAFAADGGGSTCADGACVRSAGRIDILYICLVYSFSAGGHRPCGT